MNNPEITETMSRQINSELQKIFDDNNIINEHVRHIQTPVVQKAKEFLRTQIIFEFNGHEKKI